MSALILRGDARALPLPDCSVDAVVCDPPYALEGGFMGNDWDRFASPGGDAGVGWAGYCPPDVKTPKPLDLMRWLVRLVTQPGGLILDPFAGSGTTLEAALLEGFRIVGIERDPKYLPLIQYRVDRARRRLQPGISRLRKVKSVPAPAQMAFEFDGAA